MADFAVYWRDFAEGSGEDGLPVVGWNTTRDWFLDRIRANDRFWLFTGGDVCAKSRICRGQYEAKLGYLAEIFYVETVGADHVNGDEDRCFLVRQPLLIDSIIRQPGQPATRHIGLARQTPFQLDEGEVTRLLRLLQQQRRNVYREVCGEGA